MGRRDGLAKVLAAWPAHLRKRTYSTQVGLRPPVTAAPDTHPSPKNKCNNYNNKRESKYLSLLLIMPLTEGQVFAFTQKCLVSQSLRVRPPRDHCSCSSPYSTGLEIMVELGWYVRSCT